MRTEQMSRMRAGVAVLDDKQRDVICKKVDQVLQKNRRGSKIGKLDAPCKNWNPKALV